MGCGTSRAAPRLDRRGTLIRDAPPFEVKGLRTTAGEPGDFDACWDTDGVDLDEIDPVFLDLSDANAEGPVTAHPATALR